MKLLVILLLALSMSVNAGEQLTLEDIGHDISFYKGQFTEEQKRNVYFQHFINQYFMIETGILNGEVYPYRNTAVLGCAVGQEMLRRTEMLKTKSYPAFKKFVDAECVVALSQVGK